MPILQDILTVVAPVFLIAAVGYGWARMRRPFDSLFVTELVTNIAAPCLIFATLTNMRFSPEALAEMAGATAAALLGFCAVGALVLKLARLPLRPYLPSLMFPNIGNMGLPLCLFAFGERGLALAIIYFAVTALFQFSIGVAIAMGSFELKRLARLPFLHAMWLALLFVWAEIPVPAWLSNAAGLLGDLAVPLMLLALGVALARLQVSSLRRTVGLSLLRLFMGAAIGWGIGWGLDLDPQARGVLVIQSAMPVAVFNYLFAQKYGQHAGEVASMVLVSTALSFLTLPLLLALVM